MISDSTCPCIPSIALVITANFLSHFLDLVSLVFAGALLGCAAGLVADEAIQGASRVILPLTAGGFIYVALVGVVPTLVHDDDEDEEEADVDSSDSSAKTAGAGAACKSKSKDKRVLVWQFVFEAVAMMAGVGLMVVITWFE